MNKTIKEWAKTPHKELIHFFGEMDIDLRKSLKEILEVAEHISNNCGYSVNYKKTISKEYIILHGRENESFLLVFQDGLLNYIIEKRTSKYFFNYDGEFPTIPEYYGYKGGF